MYYFKCFLECLLKSCTLINIFYHQPWGLGFSSRKGRGLAVKKGGGFKMLTLMCLLFVFPWKIAARGGSNQQNCADLIILLRFHNMILKLEICSLPYQKFSFLITKLPLYVLYKFVYFFMCFVSFILFYVVKQIICNL